MPSAMSKLVDEINKKYGGSTIIMANDSTQLKSVRRIRTGILAWDIAVGGGFPVGRAITLKGEFSTGKTMMAAKIAAAFQRHCRNCGNPIFEWDEIHMKKKHIGCGCKNSEPCRVAWDDAEHSWESDWAYTLGITPDVFVIQTEYAEQAIDIADVLIRSGEIDLLVVDSVAALTPSIEISESAEKSQVGVQARLMNKAMRKWTSAQNGEAASRVMCPSIVMINQIRLKVGVMYGNPETSPGGKGVEFHSSVVCKLSGGYPESDKEPVCKIINVNFAKNKTFAPRKLCSFQFYFTDADGYTAGATNLAAQVIQYADKWKMIEKGGSWFTLAKGVKVQGEEAASAFLMQEENKPLLQMLLKNIWAKEFPLTGGKLT